LKRKWEETREEGKMRSRKGRRVVEGGERREG